MKLFNRKKTPTVQVLKSGDVILIRDAAFLVTASALYQLPVIPVGKNKPEESENQ